MTVQTAVPPEHVQILNDFNQAFNDHNVAAMMDLMTADCVFENTFPPPDGTRYEGYPAVKQFWEQFFHESRQAHIEIEEMFVGDERGVQLWIYRWVDEQGQAGYVRGVDIFRFSNGKIAEKLSYVKG